jgi:outer membrane lipoprotein SlyB
MLVIMNFKGKLLLVKFGFLASLLTFSGCDSFNQQESSSIGTALLGGLGAGVGYALGGKNGAAIGGLIGAPIGAAVGSNMGRSAEAEKERRYYNVDEYEMRAMRKEVEHKRLQNEKILLEKERAEIIR